MEAAKANPKQFGDLPAKMDATGRADAAYAKVSRRKKHQKIAAEAGYTLAEKGPFPLLYADPPWKWGHFGEQDQENEEGKGRTPDQHYPTMTHDEILDHCVDGTPLVGIGRIQTGTGFVFRNAHEILLYGTRGKTPGPTNRHRFSSARAASTARSPRTSARRSSAPADLGRTCPTPSTPLMGQ